MYPFFHVDTSTNWYKLHILLQKITVINNHINLKINNNSKENKTRKQL